MNDKNNKSIFIIIISLALVVITGTFAWLSWRSQNTAMVLTIGDIRGLTVTLTPYQINSSLSPVSSYTDGLAIDVTAANAKSEPDNFKLYYKIDTIDNALIDPGFKYTITKCSANCDDATNYTLLNNAGGNFASASSNSNLEIYKETVPANTTYKYKVYLWIDSSAGNQSNMQNKTFQGELRASISETLYTMMRDNAVLDNTTSTYVTNSTGVNFNAISSNKNGKGLYIRAGTENDAHPIYYYRGEVDNNNVLFAGFCWKIVRTTSTGGTKLIYNGVPTGTNNNQCTNTTGTDTQLASTSKFNTKNNSPADVGYMYGTRYTYSTATDTGWYYAPDVTYSNGTYTLVSKGSYNVETKSDISGTNLNYHHYTCGSTTETTCTSVRYVYYVSSSSRAYYITLTNGKKVEDALDEMLTSSSNTTDSTIKTAIDTWYAANMTSYTNKLEDTPYCNDRTIYQLNGWNPNGGSTTGALYFNAYGRTQSPYTPSLTCNTNDAFTVSNSNGNGKLTYPVGLLTADEIRLAGGANSSSSTYYLYTDQYWWSGSPDNFTGGVAGEFYVDVAGLLGYDYVRYAYGVRPAVSLKPGTKFLSGGDGTSTNPYVVE